MLRRWLGLPATWSNPVEHFTPQAVFSLYCQLPRDSQREFLMLVGSFGTAAAPIAVAAGLTKTQQFEYSNVAYAQMAEQFLPVLIREAIKVFREDPKISDGKFAEEIEAGVRDWVERTAREMGELEREKMKEERALGHDPEIVKRNVQICELRRQNPKVYSQGKLARQFHLKPPSIRKILREEAEWRREAEKLSTN